MLDVRADRAAFALAAVGAAMIGFGGQQWSASSPPNLTFRSSIPAGDAAVAAAHVDMVRSMHGAQVKVYERQAESLVVPPPVAAVLAAVGAVFVFAAAITYGGPGRR